ncbi:hypothetical protein CDAR_282081 [Caerostris darwini]|uniref:Uncharacterized protein n=1 Tax=Caerostris darwini TaxID=1538125 RepID=A0AAV4WT44_9ARAC|nr:hypothetical protein CDAR_282081 [Caerostris darwini]
MRTVAVRPFHITDQANNLSSIEILLPQCLSLPDFQVLVSNFLNSCFIRHPLTFPPPFERTRKCIMNAFPNVLKQMHQGQNEPIDKFVVLVMALSDTL